MKLCEWENNALQSQLRLFFRLILRGESRIVDLVFGFNRLVPWFKRPSSRGYQPRERADACGSSEYLRGLLETLN